MLLSEFGATFSVKHAESFNLHLNVHFALLALFFDMELWGDLAQSTFLQSLRDDISPAAIYLGLCVSVLVAAVMVKLEISVLFIVEWDTMI